MEPRWAATNRQCASGRFRSRRWHQRSTGRTPTNPVLQLLRRHRHLAESRVGSDAIGFAQGSAMFPGCARTGNPQVGEGQVAIGPFTRQKMELTRVGELLTHAGEFLTHAGEKFAQVGEEFTHAGEKFTQVGEEFTHAGEKFTQVGEEFTHVGEKFTRVGEKLTQVGEKFTRVGESTFSGMRMGTDGSSGPWREAPWPKGPLAQGRAPRSGPGRSLRFAFVPALRARPFKCHVIRWGSILLSIVGRTSTVSRMRPGRCWSSIRSPAGSICRRSRGTSGSWPWQRISKPRPLPGGRGRESGLWDRLLSWPRIPSGSLRRPRSHPRRLSTLPAKPRGGSSGTPMPGSWLPTAMLPRNSGPESAMQCFRPGASRQRCHSWADRPSARRLDLMIQSVFRSERADGGSVSRPARWMKISEVWAVN